MTELPRRSAARRALSRTCPIAQCDVVHRLSHAGRRPVQRTGLGVALDARQCCGRAVGRRWPDRPWPSARPMRQWPHVVVRGQAACLIGCVAVASRLSGGAWPGRLPGATAAAAAGGHNDVVASYAVNPQAVAYARQMIDARQYVLESDWGKVQPRPSDQNAFLRSHSWDEYARWHLGLTDGARHHTKARYAFCLRRLPPGPSHGHHRLPLPGS